MRAGTPFVLGMLAFGGCLVDSEDRCDPGMFYAGDDRCLCGEGSVLDETGQNCVPCGTNERAIAGKCECAEGFGRPAEGEPCEPLSVALGLSCDIAANPCTDATYSHCQVVSGTEGYCTSTGCTSSADCEGDYACQLDADPTFCQRAPRGQGQTCGSSADCATLEATFCDTFVAGVCLVEHCAEKGPCHGDWVCCSINILNNSLCVPPDALDESGLCPGGLPPVETWP